MRRLSGEAENLSWLLNNLSRKLPEVVHAVVLSADGLLLAASEHLDRTSPDQLAAVASGFNSLAQGAGCHFGGGAVRQTIVEVEQGFLFVTAVWAGGCRAVLGAPDCAIGLVAYGMARLVVRVG